MTATLEQKIAAALSEADVKPSADLAQLVSEVEAAAAAADADATKAREDGLDPAVVVDVVRVATLVASAELVRDRLQAALPRLRALFERARALEYTAAWKIDHAAVEAKRDELVTELREVYPAAVATLVDLMVRIADVDRRVGHINAAAPPEVAYRLCTVEQVARGVAGFGSSGLLSLGSSGLLSLATDLKLPKFESDGDRHQFSWPQPVANADLIRACQPVPYVDTSRWFEDLRKRDAAALAKNRKQTLEAEQKQREHEKRQAAEAEAARARDRAAMAAHGWADPRAGS